MNEIETISSSPAWRRNDRLTAEIVEKGIALQEIRGTRYAAEFLKDRMVSIDVVVRVLSRCAERRSGIDAVSMPSAPEPFASNLYLS